MHVFYIGYGYDGDLRSEAELLERCPTIPAYSHALATAGAKVTVMQRFSRDVHFAEDGVAFRFKADYCSPSLRRQIPLRFHRAIAESVRAATDAVVHVNGLVFPLQLRALRRCLPCGVPIVVQHHAERPASGIKSKLQRYGLRSADGFLFASSMLAESWSRAGLISPKQPVYEVMESPVRFASPTARPASLEGAPVFLWVGRLNAGKDPLTVLDGFEEVGQHARSARLYMVYAGGELAGAVRERVEASATLRSRVTLVGALPHREMPRFYGSADFFVLGSHYEGSGYALAEAMAHEAVPVVPDIAAFATMAKGAAQFWSVGNARDCARAMNEAMSAPLPPQRAQVRQRYHDFLSPEAIARRAMAAYSDVMNRCRGRA